MGDSFDGLISPSKESTRLFAWQNFLPTPPFIERKFTSLGLYFFRACLENAKHIGSLTHGYLICSSIGPLCKLVRKTDYGTETGQLLKGDICITPSCEELSWEVIGTGEFTCIYASKCYIDQVIGSLGLTTNEPIVIKKEFQYRDKLIQGLFEAINEQLETSDYKDHVYIEAMARAMIVHLLHKNLKTSPQPWDGFQRTFSYEQMEKIRACIIERLEERILSADLARCVHVSDYHFYRIFKRTTGMTPQHFIKNFRLEKARYMLEHTQLGLYEIAYKTGFSDASHFSREFKALFGIAPRQLRHRIEYDRNFTFAL